MCPCTGWTTTFRVNGWTLRDVTLFLLVDQSGGFTYEVPRAHVIIEPTHTLEDEVLA